MTNNIQTVIFCGGKGTRMRLENLPKPLFRVGERPILWHVMKIYESWGFKDFILLLGYKKEKIISYARDYKGWDIKFLDTGLRSQWIFGFPCNNCIIRKWNQGYRTD